VRELDRRRIAGIARQAAEEIACLRRRIEGLEMRLIKTILRNVPS
jgi:hypothetical protein